MTGNPFAFEKRICMNPNNQVKELITGIVCLAVSCLILASCFLINGKGTWMQSARLMPVIVSGVMILISTCMIIRAAKKGGAKELGSYCASFGNGIKSEEFKRNISAILIVAVYIFLGIPFLGFYISSFILISAIMLIFVRRVKPVFGVLTAVLLTVVLYLVFKIGLRMNL